MSPRANTIDTRRLAGPFYALMAPLAVALVIAMTGCGEGVGECVQVYEFEGEVRKANYTRSECEEECAVIGRTLQCFFAPDSHLMPTAVAGRGNGSTMRDV